MSVEGERRRLVGLWLKSVADALGGTVDPVVQTLAVSTFDHLILAAWIAAFESLPCEHGCQRFADDTERWAPWAVWDSTTCPSHEAANEAYRARAALVDADTPRGDTGA